MGAVVNIYTLDNPRHMAIETRNLARFVVAVGARSVLRLKIFVARYARSQMLFAIRSTGVGVTHMRIMAMRTFEFAHAGTTILLQRLQRVVQRRTIGPFTVQTGNVTLSAYGVHGGGVLVGVDYLTLNPGPLVASAAGNFVLGRPLGKQRMRG